MKLSYSRLEYLLELVSITGVVLAAALLICHWAQLPDLIPRHYGLLGEVDAWGGRGTLLALPILNFGLYLPLTLLRIFGPSLSKAGTRPGTLALSMELITWVKTWTAVTFAYLTWGTVEIALGRATSLSPVLMPLFLILNLTTVAVYCVLILREAKT